MKVVIFVGLIICMLSFLKKGMTDEKFEITSLFQTLALGVVGIVISIFISMIVSAFTYAYSTNYEIQENNTYKLLQIAEESHHSYYAHQIRKNGEYQYLCLYKKKNSIETLTVDADDVILHRINDNETPKLQIQTLDIKKPSFLNFITFRCFTEKVEYHLYIPKNSINIY